MCANILSSVRSSILSSLLRPKPIWCDGTMDLTYKKSTRFFFLFSYFSITTTAAGAASTISINSSSSSSSSSSFIICHLLFFYFFSCLFWSNTGSFFILARSFFSLFAALLFAVWLLSSREHKFHLRFSFLLLLSTCSIGSANALIFASCHSIEINHSVDVNPCFFVAFHNHPVDIRSILNNSNHVTIHTSLRSIPVIKYAPQT